MKVNVDRIGATASAICAVHCVLTGLFLGLLTTSGFSFINSLAAEVSFVGTAVVVGSWAVVHGIRRHHSYVPGVFFALGMLSIVASHFVFGHSHEVGQTHVHHGGSAGTWSSVLGGLLLVTFHLLNQHYGHRCGTCSCKTPRG